MKEQKIVTADEYINRIIVSLKKIKDCHFVERGEFNNTEMRVIAAIVSANLQGKNIISTELADVLGVTRSAISQMVNRMEEKDIIRRVPAPNDRKKVYIELTERTKGLYEKEKKRLCGCLDRIVGMMGEEDMEKLVELTAKFVACQEQLAREYKENAEC